MDGVTLAQAAADTPVLVILIEILVLATLDFLIGTARALSNTVGWTQGEKFVLSALAVWVPKHLLFQVIPILLLLVASEAIPSTPDSAAVLKQTFYGAGFTAASAYTLVTLKSIVDSVNPKAADVVPTILGSLLSALVTPKAPDVAPTA